MPKKGALDIEFLPSKKLVRGILHGQAQVPSSEKEEGKEISKASVSCL